MISKDYLRLALLLSGNQAQTFSRNLLTIIKLVLLDNYGTPITIFKIIEEIQSRYRLGFSELEIKSAISKGLSGIIIHKSESSIYDLFQLSPNEYEKFKNRITPDPLPGYIQEFCHNYPESLLISQDELQEVIYRFLYQSFNSDIKTVLALMNHQVEIKTNFTDDNTFSDVEILTLDAFLNWEKPEKNKLIYEYISFCYEYCIMTVKKDKPNASSILRGKEFVLDTNIIFRLAGFNKDERKNSMISFVNMCKECGIKIRYSNFTKAEMDSTLEIIVAKIQELLKNAEPISYNAIKKIDPFIPRMDFLEQYINWTKQDYNQVGNYSAFLSDLKHRVMSCTKSFSFILHETYKQPPYNSFNSYCEDLSAFKRNRNRSTNSSAVEVDINNYFLMQELSRKSQGKSFYEQKYSFITADHAYIDWCQEKNPGTLPLFVLPSVWYSIMLKYYGRTDEDYTAFCRFLNMRVSEKIDNQQQKRDTVLASIIHLNEDVNIKEKIIYAITDQFSEVPNSPDEIDDYIESVHTRITQEEVSAAVENAQIVHNQEIDNIIKDNEINQITSHNIGYREGHSEGYWDGKKEGISQGYTTGHEEGISQGYEEAIRSVIEDRIEHIVSRNKGIRVITAILAVIGVISLLIFFVINCLGDDHIPAKLKELEQKYEILIKIISIGLTIISLLFRELSKHFSVLSTDSAVIRERLEKKYNSRKK